MTTKVIIVRHGQSSSNAAQKIQGRSNISVLTEKGRQDALSVGNSLSDLKIDAFYSSPLQRARDTAEIIQKQLRNSPELQISNLLLEVNLPIWENLAKEEVQREFPLQYKIWKEEPHLLKMPVNGQDYYPIAELYQQGQQFWSEILQKHRGQTILVVGHNGINRCLIMTASDIPSSHYHRIQQSNCCINILNFDAADNVQIESINQTAHLDMPLPKPRSNKGGLRLLLVRHGETNWNRESRFQGIKDVPLNDKGRMQAEKAAEFLSHIKLDFALSSSLSRPKETAEIILKHHNHINLELSDQLIEICHGLWEGKLEKEIEQEWTELLQQWKVSPEKAQMPEGENLSDVWDRAISCWEDLVAQYIDSERLITGLVVAHDAINKVIVCHILGLSPANIWQIKQGNGSVTVIDYQQSEHGIPILQALNITNHFGTGILDQTARGAL